jgi:hypothetical protein
MLFYQNVINPERFDPQKILSIYRRKFGDFHGFSPRLPADEILRVLPFKPARPMNLVPEGRRKFPFCGYPDRPETPKAKVKI